MYLKDVDLTGYLPEHPEDTEDVKKAKESFRAAFEAALSGDIASTYLPYDEATLKARKEFFEAFEAAKALETAQQQAKEDNADQTENEMDKMEENEMDKMEENEMDVKEDEDVKEDMEDNMEKEKDEEKPAQNIPILVVAPPGAAPFWPFAEPPANGTLVPVVGPQGHYGPRGFHYGYVLPQATLPNGIWPAYHSVFPFHVPHYILPAEEAEKKDEA